MCGESNGLIHSIIPVLLIRLCGVSFQESYSKVVLLVVGPESAVICMDDYCLGALSLHPLRIERMIPHHGNFHLC